MTEGDALLAEIIKNPTDDALRLIYADWIEENGEPERAAFIRVQCELANCPDDEALKREQMKLAAVGPDVLAGNEWRPSVWAGPWFHRGFVEVIRCKGCDVLAHLEETCLRTPLQEVVVMTPIQAKRAGRTRVIELKSDLTARYCHLTNLPRGRDSEWIRDAVLKQMFPTIKTFTYPSEPPTDLHLFFNR